MAGRHLFAKTFCITSLADRELVPFVIRSNHRPSLDMGRGGDQHVGKSTGINHAAIRHHTVAEFGKEDASRLRMATVETMVMAHLHHNDQECRKGNRQAYDIQTDCHLKTPEDAQKIAQKCFHYFSFLISIVLHALHRIRIRRIPALEEYRQVGDQKTKRASRNEAQRAKCDPVVVVLQP